MGIYRKLRRRQKREKRGHDSELQPPKTRNPGEPQQALPKYREDTASRLRNWSIENKL